MGKKTALTAIADVPVQYLPCKALRKHALDGHVFEEKDGRRIVWVARLECTHCGTWRIDVMTPRQCELISRTYVHPDDYDATISAEEARKALYRHMIDNGVSLTSLTG